MVRALGLLGVAVLSGCAAMQTPPMPAMPTHAEVDAAVAQVMAGTGAKGLAVAVIDNGIVTQVSAYGARNAIGDPLKTDSIMYGASLTKTTFAYMVAQLADAGLLDLDKSIAGALPQPLPSYSAPEIDDNYAHWSDLANDDRWKKLTPRILLNHGSGWANFGFLEPDEKLRFHFEPGTRYGYSGDGIILLQFVLERGLGLDVGREMQTRLFDPLGMKDTSLIWRDDFAGRAADGWTIEGNPEPHDDRGRVRAAGSMDTTIADMAKLAAGLVRGERLSPAARAGFVKPQLHITTPSQFPTLQEPLPAEQQRADLYAGLGVVVFDGPQGPGFMKGGHNDSTGNMMVCLEASKRCVVVLGNDLRAEAAIPWLIDFVLGPAGIPWNWEYGDAPFWKPG